MAKRKVEIGSVLKGKKKDDGSFAPDCIKIRGDHQLRDGEYLNLETKEQALADIERGVNERGLRPESAEKMRDYIEKNWKPFVRFRITVLRDQ